jgi:hypothetical protein
MSNTERPDQPVRGGRAPTGEQPTIITDRGAPSGERRAHQDVLTPPPRLSIAAQDLGADRLLAGAARVEFAGAPRPSLGGIPLLAKLGQGGMGAVYLGYKPMLESEVAVKILPPQSLAEQDADMIARFLREARIAARIASPHLVRVTDVDEESGLFYLVMEYVPGSSAAGLVRAARGAGRRGLAEAAALDVCLAATRGLAAAHAEGVVHRDVKPDNILVPTGKDGAPLPAAAKLADLGLARPAGAGGLSLTNAQLAMGTPGFMAPEQALNAREAGPPADVFSMGATLYALLSGEPPFTGESATAVVLKTIQDAPRPLRELRPDVSDASAAIIERCLAKDPALRPASAAELFELLNAARSLQGPPDAPALGQAPTPLLAPSFVARARAEGAPSPRRRMLLAAAAGVLIVLLGAFFAWPGGGSKGKNAGAAAALRLGVGTSSEKEAWMRQAAAAFASTPEGAGIAVDVFPTTADAACDAIVAGDTRYAVWTPASSLFAPVLRDRWREKHGGDPLAGGESLALTPMVFVMFEDRYDAFVKRFEHLSFATLHEALALADGWKEIAGKPEWGHFRFALPDPARHTSGLAGFTLMATEFSGVFDEAPALGIIEAPAFAAWARGFARAFGTTSGANESMRAMVLKGPSLYDGVCTYECVAIEQLDDAEGRWQPLKVVYPRANIWSDHPYYVVTAPWCSAEMRAAATAFQRFLMSEPMQNLLAVHGYRPGHPRAKIRFAGSPFLTFASRGVTIDIPTAVSTPEDAVVRAMVQHARAWFEPAIDTRK